jgi:putative ABC transport system permease protein
MGLTNTEPEALAGAVRAEVWKRDNSIPVERMQTMREIMSASLAPRRFQTALVLVFALVALGLAQLGVYGVTNYAVTRQTREIGVRFALGARQRDIVEAVMSHHLRPIATGLLLGLALAWAVTSMLRSFLFGVAPLDPLVFGTVGMALATTAMMACYIPARRASRIDPVIALRRE